MTRDYSERYTKGKKPFPKVNATNSEGPDLAQLLVLQVRLQIQALGNISWIANQLVAENAEFTESSDGIRPMENYDGYDVHGEFWGALDPTERLILHAAAMETVGSTLNSTEGGLDSAIWPSLSAAYALVQKIYGGYDDGV